MNSFQWYSFLGNYVMNKILWRVLKSNKFWELHEHMVDFVKINNQVNKKKKKRNETKMKQSHKEKLSDLIEGHDFF